MVLAPTGCGDWPLARKVTTSATPQQVRAIQMTYQRLGFKREERAQAWRRYHWLIQLGHAGAGRPGDNGVNQSAANIDDVDHADQAGITDHRQVPEMPARHGLGRVPDAGRGGDDGRASGHHVMNPDTAQILSVRDRMSDVRLSDD